MELAPPRGTADLLPPRAEAMLGLYEEAHRARAPVRVPLRGDARRSSTPSCSRAPPGDTSDVVTKEMYTFEDKGGRSLTLRPEPRRRVVRAYLEHAHDLPAPVQGVLRRHRCSGTGGRRRAGCASSGSVGVEVIGAAGPRPTWRSIALARPVPAGAGPPRRGLHLNSIGDEVCRPAYRELLIAHLEPHVDELDEDCRARLHTNPLRVLDCKVDGRRTSCWRAR